jgi:transglutaminase-like putative cysteine protease
VLTGPLDVTPATVATREITFTVTPDSYTGWAILSPQEASTVDQTTTVRTIGAGFFTGIRRDSSAASYRVTAIVPIRDGSVPGGLEENRLRAAGMDYPQEIRDLFLQMPPDAMGPDSDALLKQILAAAKQDAATHGVDVNPYDIANTIVQTLRDPAQFKYDTDVQGLPCAEQHLSTVECFARYKQGYCQYYASTMAILLRHEGIPTRIADGYLPGDRDARTGVETLLDLGRHEWVEVYFPGYGWVPFDPTGGSGVRLEPLASGAPVASASPRPSSSRGPGSSGGATRDPFGEGGTDRPSGPAPGKGPGAGLLGAMAVLLATIVGALAFMVWRRGPRGQVSPDRAYGTVTRLASRLGFGPRPNQTVYEYAGALAEVLPDARPALETVARAKVESTYGRAVFGSERLLGLREAERRLRVSLLRLLFRRGDRPR